MCVPVAQNATTVKPKIIAYICNITVFELSMQLFWQSNVNSVQSGPQYEHSRCPANGGQHTLTNVKIASATTTKVADVEAMVSGVLGQHTRHGVIVNETAT